MMQFIGSVLHEPANVVQDIFRDWRQHKQAGHELWQRTAEENISWSRQRAERIELSDETYVARYLRHSRRGIVLATLHMGDYLHAIFRLAMHLEGKRLFILRRKDQSDVETRVFSKLGSLNIKHQILRTSDGAARKAIRALRQGQVVVALYDLPATWGVTDAYRLWHLNVHWVRGPADLALLGKADILPFAAYQQTGHLACECFRPLRLDETWPDPKDMQCDEEPASPGQLLVDVAANLIRRYPAQWHHWNLLPQMLANPDAVT